MKIPKGKYIHAIHPDEIELRDKKKVALVFVCVNTNYWPYLTQVMDDCEKFFLKNHNVDVFMWTDMPGDIGLRGTVVPLEGAQWPLPTLMRYHFFLQKEEELSKYDYIFYLDSDMRVVAPITEEIMGEGLTMAEHPMYSLSPLYVPPYEPNTASTAHIKRFGIIIDDKGKPRFKPLYAAGGFQGGKAKPFIEAMKVMKKNIDEDLLKLNYMAIWNDESHWNKYLADEYKGALTVLSPSYVYPDSLQEYYERVWGCKYEPKIVTLTKPFTLKKLTNQERALLGLPPIQEITPVQCPTCQDLLHVEGHQIMQVLSCPGKGIQHQVQANKLI